MFNRLTSSGQRKAQKIKDLQQPQASNHTAASSSGTVSAGASAPQRIKSASGLSKEEMEQLYAKLNHFKIKAVALSLIDPFADQFIDQGRCLPILSMSAINSFTL